MKQVVPEYYTAFRCAAGACGHTCCAGWEIDIDAQSLERYRAMKGELGRKMKDRIQMGEDGAFFAMTPEGKCPFLNKDGLCDLILEAGERELCQICRDHPRYWNEFSDRDEIGLGFCCEEACRLILRYEEPMRLKVTEDGDDVPDDEEVLFTEERERLWNIIRDRRMPVMERVRKLAAEAEVPYFFDIQSLRQYMRTLECMDPVWYGLLERMDGSVLKSRDAFSHEIEIALEQLMATLIYRHFARVLDGETEQENLRWILRMWQTVLMVGGADGKLTLEKLEEATRMFSAEIEYSDENPQLLTDFLAGECTPFEEQVYAFVRQIPKGRVATYGTVARGIGCPGGARAVGNALHRNPDPDWTPCFRIVNTKGKLAEQFGDGGIPGQRKRLERDGICVRGDRVELAQYAWVPENGE